ncbi:MAG: DGQHR domain-containing protein [Nitrococcus mobilis]|nr:DGQHR domain-containing protein [Nitrococcus mobilis]
MANILRYTALVPNQGDSVQVCCFCATAGEILRFAKIDRVGRDEKGHLSGFQRPQVASHIKEIREYLSRREALLPNSVVVAFTRGAKLIKQGAIDVATLTVDLDDAAGFVVDGQQRLSALMDIETKFQLVVSALLCRDQDELRKQFILINNTRPLPKQLIYELLPGVTDLPDRLGSRAAAAAMVEYLNYSDASSLRGQIKQHTNPQGIIQDTVIQRVIMNSASDGALREFSRDEDGFEKGLRLISNFFAAVQNVYDYAWKGHKPKTSRLVHGAGIISMGYVMEYLHARIGAFNEEEFTPYLKCLEPHTAWTRGVWEFGSGLTRPWNDIQNIPKDYMQLTQLLLAQLRENCLCSV